MEIKLQIKEYWVYLPPYSKISDLNQRKENEGMCKVITPQMVLTGLIPNWAFVTKYWRTRQVDREAEF